MSSAAKRITQGSILNWSRIVISTAIQLIATPIFLTYWSAGEFGVWLALQAVISLFQIPGAAHQTYVGNELLKTYQIREREYSAILKAGLVVGFVYGLCETAAGVAVSVWMPSQIQSLAGAEGQSSNLARAFLILLIGSGLIWNWGGIWSRAAVSRGHYVLTAWLSVLEAVLCPIGPLIFLPFGIGLAGAACATAAMTLPVHLMGVCIMRARVVRDVGDRPAMDWCLGCRNFAHSQVLSGVNAIALLRQQGVRLILAPMSGADAVATFSTIRTGANIALKGLSTITSPLMPELMRFLNQRDQARSESAFATVWLILVALMAPAVVILQALVAPLFSAWTRGKIAFDPSLFAVLSLGVLVYALAQPAMAVAMGNNLLRAQIVLSIIAVVIVVGGMLILIPRIGILGAGVSLLLAEIASTWGYRRVIKIWLRDHGLAWPTHQSSIAATSVWIAALAMGVIAFLPRWKWICLIGAMVLLLGNLWRYWHVLPDFATHRIRALIVTFPGLKRLFASS